MSGKYYNAKVLTLILCFEYQKFKDTVSDELRILIIFYNIFV